MGARKRTRSLKRGNVEDSNAPEGKGDSDSGSRTPAAKRKVEECIKWDTKREELSDETGSTASRRLTRSQCTQHVREAANVSDEEQTRLETPSTDESVGDDVASPREGERELSKCGLHDKLAATLHGRKDKVLLLTSLLGEAGCPGYPFLFIYGNSGMGKTVVVRTVINAMKIPHAYIDCREFFTMRALLESIMDGFSGHTLSADSSYASIEQVDNVAVFVRKFKTLLRSDKFSNQTVCIVFDNAQKLGSFEANLLPALSRLHELCHDNRICVVLISCLTWERVRGTANCFDPIPIHFPNYSKDETITILSRHRPVGSPESFYRSFVSQLWSVVGQVCQDINELRHLAIMLYAKYREPVESGEVNSKDTVKLWTRIQPTLKVLMGKIYLHETVVTTTDTRQGEQVESTTSVTSDVLDLSRHSKFLLLAAYLASYNPANTDKRFFAKGKASQKRRGKNPRQITEKISRQLVGPKSFPLDRMMAIFHSIEDQPVEPSVSLFTQITSLVQLQFLAQVAMGDSYLDVPKYKCLVTLDFVLGVARSVECDVLSYLYDFI